jgi:tungstate transport system ATP-binding protein
MSALISIKDLLVRYSNQAVLQVSSLEVREGEVLAVMGPNGSGKSTLLLVLARLIHPQAGTLSFRGSPIVQESELEYRRRIALVLQEPLLLHQSVFANIASGLKFRHLPGAEIKRRTEIWLDRLGISHLRDRPANRLSGGEAQRVSLARAFALEPELLLLDEPFSALDAPTRARLLHDLHALLSQTSITTVFITHELDEALLLGDRVAVLLGGVLHQVGCPQDVFSAPTDAEVAAFVGVETVIAGKVAASQNGLLLIHADGLQLEAVGDIPVGTRVLYCLRPEDITLSVSDSHEKTSARNRLSGHIQRMTPSGPLVRVVVDCGLPLVALITRGSASDMGLHEGAHVTATFKATAVHLIPR